MVLGRTVRELELTLSHAEWVEWIAFYQLSPWGDQRLDIHYSHLSAAILKAGFPKSTFDPRDFELFPDERLGLPDDVDAQEKQWMLMLSRNERS